jgi:hypothetical protein
MVTSNGKLLVVIPSLCEFGGLADKLCVEIYVKTFSPHT